MGLSWWPSTAQSAIARRLGLWNAGIRLVERAVRVEWVLLYDQVTPVVPKIGLAHLRSITLFDSRHSAICVDSPDDVPTTPAGIHVEVVAGHKLHTGVRGRHHRVGQVARRRHVVHAEIDPHNQVRLVQRLRVKELVEVHWWVVYVLVLVRVRRPWFRVLAARY